jgi:hypothetical protein
MLDDHGALVFDLAAGGQRRRRWILHFDGWAT